MCNMGNAIIGKIDKVVEKLGATITRSAKNFLDALTLIFI